MPFATLSSHFAHTPISDPPALHLKDWRVVQTAADSVYFLGARVSGGRGTRYASAQISAIDLMQLRGRSTGGRVIELVGPPAKETREITTLMYLLMASTPIAARDVTERLCAFASRTERLRATG